MKKVQVLGTGCPKCLQTMENARQAVQALGVPVQLEKVDRPAAIAKMGVLFTPALAVDGQVKVSGRVPTVEEIKVWLA